MLCEEKKSVTRVLKTKKNGTLFFKWRTNGVCLGLFSAYVRNVFFFMMASLWKQ